MHENADAVMVIAKEKTINVLDKEKEKSTNREFLTETKDSISHILSTNLWANAPKEEQAKIKALFQKTIGTELGEKELNTLSLLLQKKEFQDEIYLILKNEKTWEIGTIILALLLGIGYAYAYGWQIIGQIKEQKRINTTSFATF